MPKNGIWNTDRIVLTSTGPMSDSYEERFPLHSTHSTTLFRGEMDAGIPFRRFIGSLKA
jgi:hypothetical protein